VRSQPHVERHPEVDRGRFAGNGPCGEAKDPDLFVARAKEAQAFRRAAHLSRDLRRRRINPSLDQSEQTTVEARGSGGSHDASLAGEL
jgi:hypothetical protein